MEKTVVLVKPDGVQRGLAGEIISRFEKAGLKIVAMKMIWVSQTVAGQHYSDKPEYLESIGVRTLANYKEYGVDPTEKLGTEDPLEIGKIVRKWNMEFIASGPVIAMLLEGFGAVKVVRKIVGSTFPSESAPGTIRGDYSFESPQWANTRGKIVKNMVHASGAVDEAEFERQLWFKEEEIYEYKRIGEEE